MNETQALLDQLRGIQTPEVSSVPAVGWWLIGLLALLVLYVAWYLIKRHKSRGWQREALRSLQTLRQGAASDPVAESLASASRLVRRVSMVNKPRMDIASLHGDAWLQELDAICGQPLFSEGFGRLLEHGPYQRAPRLSADDLYGLYDAIEELIHASGRRMRSL